MKHIAIFGSNGYLGSHFTKYCADQGAECTLFDVSESTASHVGAYVRCDVLDDSFWKSFNPQDYEGIAYFAGLSGPERSFRECELYLKVNELGLLKLLERLAPLGEFAPKIVFPSSRLVYRGGGVVAEDSPVEARSVYAANKIACEGLLSAYAHRFDVPYAVLRICVPFGNVLSSSYSYGTLGFFIRQALSGQPITVYGDGQCRKTYVHVLDVCEVAWRVMNSSKALGVYNVGGHDYTLKEVADCVARTLNGEVKCIPWPEEAARVEMGDISLNASKLSNAIGFIEYRKLESNLQSLVQG